MFVPAIIVVSKRSVGIGNQCGSGWSVDYRSFKQRAKLVCSTCKSKRTHIRKGLEMKTEIDSIEMTDNTRARIISHGYLSILWFIRAWVKLMIVDSVGCRYTPMSGDGQKFGRLSKWSFPANLRVSNEGGPMCCRITRWPEWWIL